MVRRKLDGRGVARVSVSVQFADGCRRLNRSERSCAVGVVRCFTCVRPTTGDSNTVVVVVVDKAEYVRAERPIVAISEARRGVWTIVTDSGCIGRDHQRRRCA